jgi:hypothetical protein
LSKILPFFGFWIETQEVSIIVTAEIDPVLMIHSKSPGTHFGRQRAVELSNPARIGIDSEKKKRGIVLTEGEVEGIQHSRLPRADKSSPTGSLSHRYAEVLLSK